MHALAYLLRGITSILKKIINVVRICWLRALYPGLYIDFSCNIDPNCAIKCVKGGRLTIRNTSVLNGTQIIVDAGASVIIDNAFIGRNCVITAKSSIHIHKGSLLAEMVVVRDQDHMLDVSEETGQREGFSTASIEIGENVWIASKATILKGVSIGNSSVVAASSVINKSIPPKQVWGGLPGRFLKNVEQ